MHYEALVNAVKAAMEAAKAQGGTITGQALAAVNAILSKLGAALVTSLTWDGVAIPAVAVQGGWRNAHPFLDPASRDARRLIA